MVELTSRRLIKRDVTRALPTKPVESTSSPSPSVSSGASDGGDEEEEGAPRPRLYPVPPRLRSRPHPGRRPLTGAAACGTAPARGRPSVGARR